MLREMHGLDGVFSDCFNFRQRVVFCFVLKSRHDRAKRVIIYHFFHAGPVPLAVFRSCHAVLWRLLVSAVYLAALLPQALGPRFCVFGVLVVVLLRCCVFGGLCVFVCFC